MDSQALQKLHDLAVESITKSFLHIKEITKQERLYGFALGFSKDKQAFSCIGNTLDGVEKNFTVRLKSIEDVTDYLWFASEWDYNDKSLKGAHTVNLDNFLQDHKPSHKETTDELWQDSYFQTVLQAMKTCDKNGLFGIGILRERMVIFIDSIDDEFPDLAERTSAELNPDYVHKAFLKRFEPHDPGSLTYRLISELVRDY